VPQHKLNGVLKLAIMDMLVGFVPIVGTLFDVFIRPSRRTLEIVHEHIREEYQVYSDIHVIHPFLHESLEQKQKTSAFWRNPVVSLGVATYSRFTRYCCTYFTGCIGMGRLWLSLAILSIFSDPLIDLQK